MPAAEAQNLETVERLPTAQSKLSARSFFTVQVASPTLDEEIRSCFMWKKLTASNLVETKIHCLKRLGKRQMARTFERQVAELQVSVALPVRGKPSR